MVAATSVHPLGRVTRFASALKRPRLTADEQAEAQRVGRAERWALQTEAAKLLRRRGNSLKAERVCTCMRNVRAGQEGVSILRSPQGATHYGGLMACGSVWACPVCAAKVSERRKIELQRAVTVARASGLRVVLVTYTFSHHAHQRLLGLLSALLKAQRRMKSGRAAQDRDMAYGLVGSVRSLEVTHSAENGWHPHVHELVFLPAEIDVQAFATAARAAWEKAAAHEGLSMNEHGFDCTDSTADVAAYVTKYGQEPRWQEANELTKWHVKRGRQEGRTPWDLLRASREGDPEAGMLFVEYAKAYKGRKQLVWSRDLRQLFRLGDELSDEELAEEQREEAEVVGVLSLDEWSVVLANDARAELLEVARSGVWEDVRALLAELGGID